MWGERELQRINYEAHLRAVERANEKVAERKAQRAVYPLTELSVRLVTGPPLLSFLADLMENSEVVADFRKFVKEYLPEHEEFIMRQDNEGRMREFAYYFQEEYFPLSDNLEMGDMSLEDFMSAIPVDLMGFSSDDYHSFADFREGYVAMLGIVESPLTDPGARIPVIDKLKGIVDAGLVDLIPKDAWSCDELHQAFDGTKYEGVAAFADWVNSSTPYQLLNICEEDGWAPVSWDHDTVDSITEEWPKIVAFQDKYYEMAKWLEEDIGHRFAEILGHLLEPRVVCDFVVPKEQLPLPLDKNAQVIPVGER